jgi:hypothetical protein
MMAGMFRRRPLLIVAVGLAVILTLWSYAWRQLDHAERPLVGAWRATDARYTMTLFADGTALLNAPTMQVFGTRSVHGDELTFGRPPGQLRQFCRPLAAFISWKPDRATTNRFELAADHLRITAPDGGRFDYTRISPRP